ncbi:MAG TPA: J domain-containing protein [Vicinamibacterales bacterium]|nr:J domain-containing protein [Vicinamibacterales bacterium]
MKNYYELLSVAADATADDVKRAFRREIARYHPDKVAHLGPEFLQIAEARAAELTEAYRVLMDPMARAQYDGQRGGDHGAPSGRPTPEPQRPRPRPASPGQEPLTAEPAPEAPGTPPAQHFKDERATRDEYVRRAAIARFRAAIAAALGQPDAAPARGFDAGFLARPRRGLFGKSEPAFHVLARFVPTVDAAALEETWTLASKAGTASSGGASVFLMGSGLAPAAELAGRIADLRRRSRGRVPPVVVPVDVRDWEALVPTDASPAVRTILDRLKRET